MPQNTPSTPAGSRPRTALITGASRGIGKAIAARLLDEGYRVVGLARAFAHPLEHPDFHPETVDLAHLDTLPARLGELVNRHRSIDALVLNAGQGRFGSLEEFAYPQISALMNLNFTAQTFVVRAFLPNMKREKNGNIVFMGSEAALWGGRRGAIYSASKAALRGFAQALRQECAPSNVRVSVVNPGMVRTEFFEELGFAPGEAPEHALLAEEVADAVVHLLGYRSGVVVDEINLSPLTRVLHFKKSAQKPPGE